MIAIWYLSVLMMVKDSNWNEQITVVRYPTASQMECFNILSRVKITPSGGWDGRSVSYYCAQGDPVRMDIPKVSVP